MRAKREGGKTSCPDDKRMSLSLAVRPLTVRRAKIGALQMGAKLVESGAHSKVLVIGADTMSSIIDYTAAQADPRHRAIH